MNGAAINGHAINGSGAPPVMRATLTPLRIGAIRVTALTPAAAGIAPVRIHRPPRVAAASSLRPVRFGDVQAVSTGVVPSVMVAAASSLEPVRFGPVSIQGTLATPAAGLRVGRMGAVTAQAVTPAAGLSAARLGGAGTAARSAPAAGLRPVRFGAAHAVMAREAASLQPLKFGPVHAVLGGLTVGAASLTPVRLGAPGQWTMHAKARGLRAVRFGPVVADRGAAC